MKQSLGFSLFLLSILSAAQIYTPRYDNSECPFFIRRMAEDSGADISCGFLFISEDRQATSGSRLISLFVVRIAARNHDGNAPLLFLNGGPGAPIAARIPSVLASRLHENYEIIAIDQRGAGFSRPSLNCWEEDGRTDTSGFVWIQYCYRRLVDQGIALRAYNSASITQDIQDLLNVLEISEANVYGVSYGSRLALTLARDFPQRVRAMILDGVLPLHVRKLESHALNGYRAIEKLLADCGADADCNRAYPNLSNSFYSSLARMNQEPAEVKQANLDYPIVVTGDDFVAEIYTKLYDKQLIPVLPALIAAYAKGDYDFDATELASRRESLAPMESEWLREMEQLSEGTAYSVTCAEEIPFNSRDRIVNQAARLPGLVRRPLVGMALDSIAKCEAWDVPAAPDLVNQPVSSDIPTLLLSGRYDPVTPPEWGDEAAKRLANSWHYVFPAAGHGVLFESDASCAELIAQSFLAAPRIRPADACLETMTRPDFYIRP